MVQGLHPGMASEACGGGSVFKVKHLPSGEVFRVYGICGTLFLAWNQQADAGCWEWLKMEQCVPVDEEEA